MGKADCIVGLTLIVKDYIMAGNTRGKIKEHLEGVHRNFDWADVHLEKTLVLIQEHNPKLTEGIHAVKEAIKVLDETVQGVYGQI